MDAASRSNVTISAIVATYNRAHYLPQALDSLLAQTHPADEIIVVDDGSTDATPEILARYGPRLRCIRTGNRGKAAALNLAIPQAKGDRIWLFDDDDVALPNALQLHLEFLDRNPHVDFTYSTNYTVSGTDDIWHPQAWIPKDLPDTPPEQFLLVTMHYMTTLLQGMLIRKACFAEVGYFDEGMARNQDLDILIRIAYRFVGRNILAPTFVYRDHAGAHGPGAGWRTKRTFERARRDYQQRVHRKAHDMFPLAAYLPNFPGSPLPALDSDQHRLALLERCCIMWHQGLAREALDDLAQALGPDSDIPYEVAGPMLASACNTDPARFDRPWRTLWALQKCLVVHQARLLLRFVIQGTWWSLHAALRRHAWRSALSAGCMLCIGGLSRVFLLLGP